MSCRPVDIMMMIYFIYLAFLGAVSGWQQARYRSTTSVGESASVSSASHSSATSGARAGDVCDPYPSEFSWNKLDSIVHVMGTVNFSVSNKIFTVIYDFCEKIFYDVQEFWVWFKLKDVCVIFSQFRLVVCALCLMSRIYLKRAIAHDSIFEFLLSSISESNQITGAKQ